MGFFWLFIKLVVLSDGNVVDDKGKSTYFFIGVLNYSRFLSFAEFTKDLKSSLKFIELALYFKESFIASDDNLPENKDSWLASILEPEDW